MKRKSRRHWKPSDFIVTSTSPAYDGSNVANRFGYCRVCHADMQSFGTKGKNGPILHYSSHRNARALGFAA